MSDANVRIERLERSVEGLLRERRWLRRALVAAAIVAVGAPTWLFASATLPHSFQNGAVASAEAVNANFAELARAVNENSAQLASK